MMSCGEKLVLGFNRTWPGHRDELAATNFEIQHPHNSLLVFVTLQNITSLGKTFLPTWAHPRRSDPGKRQSTARGTPSPPSKG
jgi:hypothetical protein